LPFGFFKNLFNLMPQCGNRNQLDNWRFDGCIRDEKVIV